MRKLWMVSTLTMLLAGPLVAGVVYEIEVKDHEQSPPKTESIQAAVEGRNLKMGIASGESGQQGEMIFRGDRREMVVVDHEDGSYHVMDKETLARIADQTSDAMARMREALDAVPEDRREMVEEMMKKRMPQTSSVSPAESVLERTGERADRQGYPCVRYEVLRDGRKIRELWVTDWSNIEGGADVVGAFEDMADFFREMMNSMPDFGLGDSSRRDPVFEHMKELGGFPVVTRTYGEDGSLEDESTLRSWRRQTLDPDAFEPPAGYKRREMFRP